MIHLHRLNGKEFVVNADMIKFIETTPDTLVSLNVGGDKDEKFMVKESVDEVLRLVMTYRQKCNQGPEVRGNA